MNKRTAPVIILIFAVLIGSGLWLDHQRAEQRATLTGYFEYRPTDIASRVTGRVVELNVDEGDVADKGEALIQLDASPQSEDFNAKQAQSRSAYQQLLEAQHGPRSYDIARQQAIVETAQANLTKLLNGALPEERIQATAQVAAAKAAYSDAVNGPMPGQLAQAKVFALKARQRWLDAIRQQNGGQVTALKSDLDSTIAAENKAESNAKRIDSLAAVGAATGQQRDDADTALQIAQANVTKARTDFTNELSGSNSISVDEAHQTLEDSETQMQLLYADTRPGIVQERKEQLLQAEASQRLLLNGPRKEDIDAARANLAQAQATLAELEAGTRPEETSAAYAQWAAAKASANSARSIAAEQTVKAPFHCVIEHVLIADGDLLSAGTPLLRVANPADIWLTIYVPESHLASVNVGEAAVLNVDGVNGDVNAVVKSIATNGEFTPANLQSPEERGQQVFAVRLRLKTPDSRIKAGMAATVESIGDWSP